MYDCLKKHGIQLASNQVEFSLLRRTPETSGLIAECHKRGVAVLGYSPLVPLSSWVVLYEKYLNFSFLIRLWVV